MEFRLVAEAFEQIESTAARLEMMAQLAGLFKKASASEIGKLVYFSQGVLAPPFEGIESGMGEKFVVQAIALAAGFEPKSVEKAYKKSGDLGTTAAGLIEKKPQQSLHSETLQFSRVFDAFSKLSRISGAGAQEKKIGALAELLNSASPLEAKFLVRFPIGKLRLGAGDATILEALSLAHSDAREEKQALERAYNLSSDLGLVAETLFRDGIDGVRNYRITPFHPVRPALAERLPSAEEIIGKMGTASVEAKYDGMRMQVHKAGKRVEIYSRNLERTTDMFPEIAEAVVRDIKAHDAVFEGEALAFNATTSEFYPFQVTATRKRKYGVDGKAEDIPVKLFVFDVLYLDGEDCAELPYRERRKRLEKMVGNGDTIRPSARIVTSDAAELQKYFDESIASGLEGVIAKDLEAPYVAGARKFAWIKLKRSYRGELADTIDVVIVGYFLGRGKRAEFGFGGFLGAVYDEKEDRFKTVTKVGTGFSEEQMTELKKMLDKIKQKGKPKQLDSLIVPDVWVEPRYVVTLTADEITRSPLHTAGMTDGANGYALRFPRLTGEIRTDKNAYDATSVKEIVEMFALQKTSSLA